MLYATDLGTVGGRVSQYESVHVIVSVIRVDCNMRFHRCFRITEGSKTITASNRTRVDQLHQIQFKKVSHAAKKVTHFKNKGNAW